MTYNQIECIYNLIISLVCLIIVYKATKLIGRNDRSVTAVFFVFGVSSLLLSYIYWLAYDLLRPEVRMPFAANEMGEIACNLLFASTMATIFGKEKLDSYKEVAFGVALEAGCIFLWIGWSGEWIQDIISGVVLCYTMYMMIRSAKITNAFTRNEWRVQGAILTLLVALEGLTFAFSEEISHTLDTICYVIIFSMATFYLIKVISAVKQRTESMKLFCISGIGFYYCMNAMYMSAEPMYFMAEILNNFMLIIMFVAIKRVVLNE